MPIKHSKQSTVSDGGNTTVVRPSDWNLDHVVASGISIAGNGTTYTGYSLVPLATPLTSSAWNGNPHSTESPTLIDLSSVFGAPANIKAVVIAVTTQDAGTWGSDEYFAAFGASASYADSVISPCYGGDKRGRAAGVCPCDSNGDIYYQCYASGSGTLDITMNIRGYFI